MYKYWTAFESEEHCLYPKEVAELWKIYSISSPRSNHYGKFNDVLANELLKESSDVLGKEAIYYETRYGLRRVFDHETIQHASQTLMNRLEKDRAIFYCPINGKRYKLAIGEENLKPAMMQMHPEWFEEDGSRIKSWDRMEERREELKERKKVKA